MAQNLSPLCYRRLSTLEIEQDDTPLNREQPRLHRAFTTKSLPATVLEVKYAVRGAVAEKAEEVRAKLAAGEKLGFDRVIDCSIGNPHAVHQQPITFYRQVAAALYDPSLLEAGVYPADVVSRAKEYLAAMNSAGVGAYTHSNGLPLCRQQIANFIAARDGFPADPNCITLTTGASEGVKRTIAAFIDTPEDGMMIPRPQYPLYSAALTMQGGRMVFYELFEGKGWTTTREEMERALAEAKAEGTTVKAICVINPGNPVGAVLTRDGVTEFIRFAVAHDLVILADEVYQTNVYADNASFHSFKKVLSELLQEEQRMFREAQLISFHSTSKGIVGECGQRGGYMEFVNFSNATLGQLTKVAATSLSPCTIGQVFAALMAAPPKEGDPSFPLFEEETKCIFAGLKRRAAMLSKGLNEIPGIESQLIQGAMYAFPRVRLPEGALAEAKRLGVEGDLLFCLELVEAAGIVTTPGSGFGQAEGTLHFRTTILPPDHMLEDMLARLRTFMEAFAKRYGP